MGTICAFDTPSKNLVIKDVTGPDYEEILAQRYERLCPLKNISPENIKNTLQGQGVGENLTFTQVKRALGLLGMEKSSLENPDHANFLFVASFELDQVFVRIHLLVACVMLSNAKPLEKLKVFFEIFDEDQKRMLNNAEVRNLLGIMFHVSTFNTLYLSFGKKNSNCLLNSQIIEYHNSLVKEKHRFVSEILIVVLLGQTEIGEGKFFEILGQGRYAELLSPSGLRKYILMFKSNQ